MSRSLAALYRRHHRLVWWTVRACRVPERAVEDVVQEVFLAVDRRWDGAPREDLRPWLVGVARSVSHSHRRADYRRRVRDRTWLDERDAPEAGVEGRLDARRSLQVVFERLDDLDPAQREAFVLAILHGLPPAEVAQIQGVSRNTVYSRLRLARQHLLEVPEPHIARAAREGTPTRERAQRVWGGILAHSAPPAIAAATGTTLAVGTTLALGLAIVVGAGVGASRSGRSASRSPAPMATTSILAESRTLPDPAPVEPVSPRAALSWDTPTRTGDAAPSSTRKSSTTRMGASSAPVPESEPTLSPSAASGSATDTEGAALVEETRLLQEAVRALDRGDVRAARQQLGRHAREFTFGRLAAERERLLGEIASPPHTDEATP